MQCERHELISSSALTIEDGELSLVYPRPRGQCSCSSQGIPYVQHCSSIDH